MQTVNEHGRQNKKNVFSNQFSISFVIMSSYLLKMTKIFYSNLESSTRVSSALLEVRITRRIAITAHFIQLCRWYNQKLIRVMSPLSGGDGRTGEYRLETGSRHIAFKRVLNVY